MTEERILDFLDGNLGASEEEELLHRLAVSPERRILLKQHLQMRELTAVLARKSYVNVPKVLTASLFTTLAANGYAGPSMPSAVESLESIKFASNRSLDRAAENVVASGSVGLFTRSTILLASVVSFVIGAAAIYFAMPQGHAEKFASSVSAVLEAPALSAQSTNADARQLNSFSASDIGSKIMGTDVAAHSRNEATDKYSEHSVGLAQNSDDADLAVGNTPGLLTDMGSVAILDHISSVKPQNPAMIMPPSDVHGSTYTAKNPFDPIMPISASEKSFLQRLTFSFRAGEGKAPGNDQALTGSLLEVKTSYDISDLFDIKLSIGQFMPYEKQAVVANPQFNSDGFRLLQISPVLQYRAILGAEIGAKFNLFDAPFEFSGGVISDLRGNIIPRLGFFTSLALQDNLSMNIGLEGMIYSHDISASLRNAEAAYAGEHPSLIGEVQNKEITGFIGPSVEMVWHF